MISKRKGTLAGAAVRLALFLALATGSRRAAASVRPPAKPAVTVGVYYFDGWNSRNSHLTKELATRFAYRKPLWGWYDNTQAILQEEINLAADHDIAFFAFEWFNRTVANNNALHLFLKAPNRNRMRFCLDICSDITPKEWKSCSRRWLAYFRRPTYLRLRGQAFLIMGNPGGLGAMVRNFGGIRAVHNAFAQLRAQAKREGAPGIQIAGTSWPPAKDLLSKLVRAGYNEVTDTGYRPVRYDRWVLHSRPKPFSDLIASSRRKFDSFVGAPLLYIPVISVGCDHRGTNDFRASDWFPRTPHGLERFVRMGVRWIYHFHHGSPSPAKRMLMLGAWNAYGSDAFLTPTAARGDAYLDAVQRAVASPPNAHTGELPAMRKIVPYPAQQ